MTSTAPWLSRQRKPELTEMAEAAGMKDFKNLKKVDLETELDNYLRANQPTLQNHPKLADFFKRVKDGSPSAAGKELVKSESKTPSKPRRRTLAPKDDVLSDSETPDANALRTPARQSLGVASQIPLPPSPAVVAQEVERQTARFSAWAGDLYAQTGVSTYVEWTRDRASSSQAVTTISLFLEAFVLMSSLLPYKYLGIEIPAIAGFSAIPLRAPHFWNLLELRFWSTTFLWAAVSVLLPALTAYIFNLSRVQSKAPKNSFDLLIFNAVKGLLVWLVFEQDVPLGTIALYEGRMSLVLGIPGGHLWLFVSAIFGGLVALYEAILRR